MKHVRALVALLGMLVWAAELHAQVPFVGPGPGAAVGFSGRRFSGGLAIGGGYPGPFYSNYGYGGPRFTSISIYSPGPSYAQPLVISPQVTINITNVLNDVRDEDHPDKIIIRPRQRTVRDADPPVAKPEKIGEPLLPGDPAGAFRPLVPEDRARAQQPPPAPAPKAPALPVGDRLLAQGRAAFAEQEYGRAERFFQSATEFAPKDHLAFFLLAQAQFAVGKYKEAVVSIHSGLRLKPDWPDARFRVRPLYENNADDFTDQLRDLETVLLDNRNDPAVFFLYAYELWFDGRQEEARPIFRRALPRVTEPRFIEMFLLPPGQVVLR
jgi:hypothetical protein